MKKNVLCMLIIPFTLTKIAYAAEAINLSHEPSIALKNYIEPRRSLTTKETVTSEREISRVTDGQEKTHIRVQQTYLGFDVYGADAVIHIPSDNGKRRALLNQNETVNGVFYRLIEKDLINQSADILKTNEKKAELTAIDLAKKTYGQDYSVKDVKIEPMIYMDNNSKAHYAFYVNLILLADNKKPVEPIYILDANSLSVFETWNNLKTLNVFGGGFGGNQKKQWIYDGQHLNKLTIERDDAKQICQFKNNHVEVFDFQKIGYYGKIEKSLQSNDALSNFKCMTTNDQKLYWSGSFDMTNGGYSPANDALFAGEIIQNMYMNWYGMPMLTKVDPKDKTKKIPMTLQMFIHITDPDTDSTTPNGMYKYNEYENAFWTNYFNAIFLGDGSEDAYPLTSIGVVAHEVSHGFTAQHSNLTYANQSGGINESFSDMAAQAAEEYAYGKMTGLIGGEIVKADNESIRYLNQPSLDCQGRQPGYVCSIDEASQYNYLVKMAEQYGRIEGRKQSIIVHYASGVFNRAFYLLANTPNWSAKKAFAIMVHANSYYWTKNANFQSAACGVMSAAEDLKYETNDVEKAFRAVGIDVKAC